MQSNRNSKIKAISLSNILLIAKRQIEIQETLASIKSQIYEYIVTKRYTQKKIPLTDIEQQNQKYFLQNREDKTATSHTFDEWYSRLSEILIHITPLDIETIGDAHPSAIISYLSQCYDILHAAGFHYVHGESISFWSGLKAMEKAKNEFNDYSFPAIKIMFALCKFIYEQEKKEGRSNITGVLDDINCRMFAVRATRTAKIFLSSDKKSEDKLVLSEKNNPGLTANNHLWNAELFVLQKLHFRNIVTEIILYLYINHKWEPRNLHAKEDWPFICIRRRDAHPYDIKQDRFQKKGRDQSWAEFNAWQKTESRPSTNLYRLESLMTKVLVNPRENLKSRAQDADLLKNFATSTDEPDYKTTEGKEISRSFRLLESNDYFGINRYIKDLDWLKRLINAPHYLTNENRNKILKHIQHAKAISEAIHYLDQQNKMSNEAIDLILQNPENALQISKAYVKTREHFPSRLSLLPDEDNDTFFKMIEDIIVILPFYATELIKIFRQFYVNALFLNDKEKEIVRNALLIEEVASKGEIFLKICHLLHGFKISQSSIEEKETKPDELIDLKGGNQLKIWSLITPENIMQLAFCIDHLSQIYPAIKDIHQKGEVTQEDLTAIFQNIFKKVEILENKSEHKTVQENMASIFQHFSKPLEDCEDKREIKSVDDKIIMPTKAFSLRMTEFDDVINDINILTRVDINTFSLHHITGLKTYSGKAAARCFEELHNASYFYHHLNEKYKKLVIINIRYAHDILRAFEYLNSGLRQGLCFIATDRIFKNPQDALKIAKDILPSYRQNFGFFGFIREALFQSNTSQPSSLRP